MIKQILIFILVITICDCGFAQSDSSKLKMKKFITSVEFHSQLCYRIMDASDNTTTVQKLSTDILPYTRNETYDPKNDKAGLSFGGGLFGNIKIYKGLRIKCGIGYETFKYHTGKIDTFVTSNSNFDISSNSTVITINKKVNNTRIDYDFHFTSLFLSVNYYFKLSEKVFLNTAVSYVPTAYQYIGITKTDYDTGEKRVENLRNKKPNFRENQFLKLAVGLNYYVNNKFFISVEPFFKYGLKNKIPHFGYRTEKINFYSAGCNIGFNF